VHRCLAKAPVDRYQSAIDVRHDLEDARQAMASGAVPQDDAIAVRRRSRSSKLALLAAAMGGAAVIALGIFAVSSGVFESRRDAETLAVPRLANAVQVTHSLDVESYPTWSPDGLGLAYQAGDLGWYYVGNHDVG
jgi:hypothetical protein